MLKRKTQKKDAMGGIYTRDGELKVDFHGEGALLIPSKGRTKIIEVSSEPYIQYPVPENWMSKPLLLSDDSRVVYPLELLELGWQWVTKQPAKKILTDFIDLEGNPKTGESPATDEEIKVFAERYGPLWCCFQDKHEDCIFAPFKGHNQPCGWIPIEPIFEFRRRIKQISAAVEIIKLLKENQIVDDDLWNNFGIGYAGKLSKKMVNNFKKIASQSALDEWPEGAEVITWQKQFFSIQLNIFLSEISPQLSYWWADKPRIYLGTGRGFFNLLLMELATSITEESLHFCVECGNLEPRTRKPQSKRDVYCKSCGKESGYRSAKRKSKRRRKERGDKMNKKMDRKGKSKK